jgi:hypothetical protein
LPLLYGQVFAPPAVIEEMRAPNKRTVGVREKLVSDHLFLRNHEPTPIFVRAENQSLPPERFKTGPASARRHGGLSTASAWRRVIGRRSTRGTGTMPARRSPSGQRVFSIGLGWALIVLAVIGLLVTWVLTG